MLDTTAAQVLQELDRLRNCTDDHERLRVEFQPNSKTLRRAFMRLSRRYHPDLHTSADAEMRANIQEVYMLLSEAEQRLRFRWGMGGTPRTVPPEAPSRSAVATISAPPNVDHVRTIMAGDPPRTAPSRARSKRQVSVSSPLSTAPRADSMSGDSATPRSDAVASAADLAAAEPNTDEMYGLALAAMIAREYKKAASLLDKLSRMHSDVEEYQTAREMAQGYLRRDAGDLDAALEHFHRACVTNGGCADALDAIRAMQPSAEVEERLLSRLLGEG